MRESDLGTYVEALLDLHGWLWKHDQPAVRQSGRWATAFAGDRGFPDYVAVRRGRLVFAELKSERGRVSLEQASWLNQLRIAGVETYLWRPADMDQIKEILK